MSELKDYKKEIINLLVQFEGILKGNNKFASINELNQIYTLSHKLDEVAGVYGLNCISGIFSFIEQGLSNLIESKQELTKSNVGILISAVSLTHTLIDDPTLKNTGLKTKYENLKKEIVKTFISNNKESEDNSFSNKRFQEIFIEEANDLINQLEEKLLQLESEPNDLELVDNIFRIMHTLKGNSNMFGFKHLGEITHHLENIYDAIRSQQLDINRIILDNTLQCIDHFRNLIEDADLTDVNNKVIHKSILNDITEILDGDKKEQKEIESIQAESNELKTFYLFFQPQPNIIDDGSNPLYFMYDLHDLGNCLVQPVTSSIPEPKNYNPEKCYISWHILIATKDTKDSLLENFMFLGDDSQPSIDFLTKSNLLENTEFISKFKSAAVSNKSILSELGIQATEKISSIVKPDKVAKSKSTDSSITSIRVSSAKIDLMMNLISELVTKQAELSMLANDKNINRLQEVVESIESISRELRDNAFSISLIPLEKTVLRFQRLVRDVSTKFNKKVDFIVEGKETELDKTIIEKIVDPIMHILRNSIDHGIETPDKRKKLGKSETGTIILKAYPSGAHVIIEISDDGAGINVEKVRQAALKKGFISEADEFSTDNMLKLIMSPGFSTAENVSEVSGRGVGMDVVSQKINEIRGELDIKTEANKGTTISIKLPLTISIIDSLLIMIGETYYLIPLSVVERCVEVTTPTITESSTKYLNIDGKYIPFIDLHKEFDISEDRLNYQRLIIVNHKNIPVALVVDQIIGNHQAVLKSLGQVYRRQEIISGASILGNGEIALVLDTNKLVQEYMANCKEELYKINLLNTKETAPLN